MPAENVQVVAVEELVFWRVLRHGLRVAYPPSTKRRYGIGSGLVDGLVKLPDSSFVVQTQPD